MTDLNHRRKNRKPVNQRQTANDSTYAYNNGYGCRDSIRGAIQRVGNTDYLDKSMHGWGKKSALADTYVVATIGNDYCNGHRGMAKAVKGAKKFVRTRIRFRENAATKKLSPHADDT